MIAELFKQKASLYGLPHEDLANAVSALQYEDKGMFASAKEYRNMIVSEGMDVWVAARELKEETK